MSIKNKLILLITVLLIFLSGMLTERSQIDNKFKDFLKDSFDATSRIIYTIIPRKELLIEIKPKEFRKILDVREKSIKQSKLTKDLERWSDGKIISDKNNRNIQIRLKGVFPDHWSDKQRWSFKVKIKNDSKPFNNLTRFALQPPNTTSYIYEWLFMKALEKEKLFSLGADFIDLKINDKKIGIYSLIGQLSNDLLKKNNKKISPVIGFDSELWIKEQIKSQELHSKNVIRRENSIEDVYYRVKINPIQFSPEDNKENITNLKEAINILESFRQGKLKTSEAFNIDHLAKIMAIRALLGSYQFDWLDTKFYYNTDTKLLEPISKEIHVDLEHNYKKYYPTWWIDSYVSRPDFVKSKDFFVDDIFKDNFFYEKYLKTLNQFSNTKYFENLIKENEKEFKRYLKMLKMNYPTKKIFSKEHLEITRLRIQNYLNPVQDLNVYFKEFKDGYLTLNISNLQRLPIRIIGLNLEDGSSLKIEEETFINGSKPFLPINSENLKFNCNFKSSCKKNKIDNQKLIFKIMGQENEKFASISPFYK